MSTTTRRTRNRRFLIADTCDYCMGMDMGFDGKHHEKSAMDSVILNGLVMHDEDGDGVVALGWL